MRMSSWSSTCESELWVGFCLVLNCFLLSLVPLWWCYHLLFSWVQLRPVVRANCHVHLQAFGLQSGGIGGTWGRFPFLPSPIGWCSDTSKVIFLAFKTEWGMISCFCSAVWSSDGAMVKHLFQLSVFQRENWMATKFPYTSLCSRKMSWPFNPLSLLLIGLFLQVQSQLSSMHFKRIAWTTRCHNSCWFDHLIIISCSLSLHTHHLHTHVNPLNLHYLTPELCNYSAIREFPPFVWKTQ